MAEGNGEGSKMTVGESILHGERWWRGSSQSTLGLLLIISVIIHKIGSCNSQT